MPGLLAATIVFGTVLVAELPDNSGLALGTRYRAGGVFAGAAAAFAVHVVLAVTYGSLLGLLPHQIVQIAVAVVFLAGAVLVLRGDSGDEPATVARQVQGSRRRSQPVALRDQAGRARLGA